MTLAEGDIIRIRINFQFYSRSSFGCCPLHSGKACAAFNSIVDLLYVDLLAPGCEHIASFNSIVDLHLDANGIWVVRALFFQFYSRSSRGGEDIAIDDIYSLSIL